MRFRIWFWCLSCLAFAGCHARRELLYVSCEQSAEVVVVDPLKAAVVERIAVGKRPRGLKLSHDGSQLYVAQSGSPAAGPGVDESKLPPADRAADGIGVVDLASSRYEHALPGGQDPEAFDLSPDGRTLYIANEETAELSVLDIGARKIVQRIAVGKQPEGVSVRPDGEVVYVTSEEDDNVSVVDTHSGQVRARIPTDKRPRAIAFASGEPTLLGFVTNEVGGSLTIFDTATEQPLRTLPIAADGAPPQRPMGAVVSQDGKRLYVSTGRGGTVAVIDIERRRLERLIKDIGARPWGIALSPDGKRLYTANGPSHDITILELASGKLQRVKVGGSPWGVVAALR
jgi:YVTN family beta-propeller protein